MKTVSHHLLRRRARRRAKLLNAHGKQGYRYEVVEAERGPWRWRVVEVRL